jgi:outer membrane receptor for ferrienterochelin and colicin
VQLTKMMLSGIAALSLLASTAAAQGVTTGSVAGQVTDQANGAPVASATVTAVNLQTGFQRQTNTAANGLFTIPLLPPGTYVVRVRRIGYRPEALTGLTVRLGERAAANLALTAAAVELEAVVVESEAGGIDAADASVTQSVSTDAIENLPSLGRDFTDFIRLSGFVGPNPEETTGGKFSIAGQRPSQTSIQIDGADANSGFFGENRGGSRIPFSFSLESIREFQIITNGYDVEYGQYSGGIVNVVTRGGTNEFEGTLYGNFRNATLTKGEFDGGAPGDYSVTQYAGRVSGPIKRDKAFFLLSLDGQRRREPQTPLTQAAFLGGAAPDSATADSVSRFFDILENQYGIADPETGYVPFQTSNDVVTLFGRVDWTLSDNHRLSVRHNFSNYNNDLEFNENFDFIYGRSRAETLEDVAHSFVTEMQSVLGARTFNVFRFQFASEKRPRNGLELRPALIVSLGTGQQAGYGGTFASFQNNLEERKLQFIDNLTHAIGSHTFKVGGAFLSTALENRFILSGAGEYRFATLADFAAYRPSSFVRNVRSDGQVPFSEFTVSEWAVYAQDEWKPVPRLTVTAGVRYDRESFGDAPARVFSAENAFGLETGFAPIDNDNWSPRLALAYDLDGEGRAVVRGGAGYFYGRVPYVVGGNVQQTVLPVLTLTCTGDPAEGDPDAPPDPSPYGGWTPAGDDNPSACAGAGGVGGVPTYTFWTSDFEFPETFKANLGYERLLGRRTRFSVDLVYSRSTRLYTVRNLNLRDPLFTLDAEGGRRIFQPAASFNPAATSTAHRRNLEFGDVYVNYNDGRARSVAVSLEASHRLGDQTTLGASYTYTSAYDNSSYSCCTATEGYTSPSVGPFGPNEIGEAGDTQRAWGPSDFVRNHTIVLEARTRLPWGFQVNAFWRMQSGNPWTPEQSGDLNGDGIRFNDRPFIYAAADLPLAATDPAEAQAQRDRYAGYLEAHECVARHVGQIISRNACRFGWFNRLDLRIAKSLNTFGEQRLELQLDLFNVLNGINRDWGRYRGIFAANRNLVAPESFDAASGQILYSVPTTFGQEGVIGTNLLLQFQAQIGARYYF